MSMDKEAKKSGKVARFYSVNQKKLDEACQGMLDELILPLVSEAKLAQIRRQLLEQPSSPPPVLSDGEMAETTGHKERIFIGRWE